MLTVAALDNTVSDRLFMAIYAVYTVVWSIMCSRVFSFATVNIPPSSMTLDRYLQQVLSMFNSQKRRRGISKLPTCHKLLSTCSDVLWESHNTQKEYPDGMS